MPSKPGTDFRIDDFDSYKVVTPSQDYIIFLEKYFVNRMSKNK